MKKRSHIDANIALSIILILMVSLLAMNTGYIEYKSLMGEKIVGIYPIELNPFRVFYRWKGRELQSYA